MHLALYLSQKEPTDFAEEAKMTSRYGAAISFVFKAQRRAHSRAYVTEAATQKTDVRANKLVCDLTEIA